MLLAFPQSRQRGESEVEKNAWIPAECIVLLLSSPRSLLHTFRLPTQHRRGSKFLLLAGEETLPRPQAQRRLTVLRVICTTDTVKNNQTSRHCAGCFMFYNFYFLEPYDGSAILNIRSGSVLQELRRREAC